MNNNFWYIETWDKEIVKVKPEEKQIKYIQNLISKNEGAIVMPTRVIPIKNVKDFRLSDERYVDQKLIEASSQAFNEPIYTKDGVQAKWVKKSVTRRRWDTYYRHSGFYRILERSDNAVLVAFRLPTHQINHELVQDLAEDEERKLSVKVDK